MSAGGRGFRVPSSTEQEQACSTSTAATPRQFAACAELFAPIAAPQPGDWLDSFDEAGQTFEQYLQANRHRPLRAGDKIYLLPLGEFAAGGGPSPAVLAAYTSSFFDVPVVLLPGVELTRPSDAGKRWQTTAVLADELVAGRHVKPKRLRVQTRVNGGVTQFNVVDLLKLLDAVRPADAYCIMGITMTDLYPQESWNFVFGAANPPSASGVFSFARDSPRFGAAAAAPLTAADQCLMLKRSLHTLVHEILHLFYMEHCVYFSCVLNGSNNRDETDRQPLHLCPCDLRKLHHVNPTMDVLSRERKLTPVPAYLNVTQTIQQYGYQAEYHTVTTADGWVLGLQRILPSGGGSARGAVYLQHGLLDSGYTWVANLPSQSLGYMLADAGYDVWLGNSRGNTWSMVYLPDNNANSTQFWNFTWDQMLTGDLPSVLDYVTAASRVARVAYVGHSQGGIIGFGGLAWQPSLQSKVSVLIGLAPAVYLTNCSAPGAQAAAKLPTSLIYQALGHLGYGESTPATQARDAQECADSPLACQDAICLAAGCASPSNYNASALPALAQHFPAGTSTKDIGHLQQQIKRLTFQWYDYGQSGNEKAYGSPSPPVYNLANLPASLPMAVFYGGRDKLVNYTDVDYLLAQLPPTTYSQLLPTFGHGDFVWGLNAATELYPQVIDIINKYN